MSKNANDKTLRVSKKTHTILEEINYKTKDSMRDLTEEAVVDLKVKRLKKRKKS